MTKISTKTPSTLTLKVETQRFGPFVFQIGVDMDALAVPILRFTDAYERFTASPLSQVANKLEQEVLVQSVFGTNTIEGGTLSEDETAEALMLAPGEIAEVEQRRAMNIKMAYEFAQNAASRTDWVLDRAFILELHRLITNQVPHADNQPGVIRNNPKSRVTAVGDASHGGQYRTPQFGRDVSKLLDALIEWHAKLVGADMSPLIRAPLVHLYFELIHPFWDGNGRVGRIIEAAVLLSSGYRYAPLSLASYYLKNIDRYFLLFSTSRKNAEAKRRLANQEFVEFHIEGLRETVNRLHDRVNSIVSVLLYVDAARRALEEKKINARQYTILSQLIEKGRPMTMDELLQAPWYKSLYLKRTERTRQRDLREIRALKFISIDESNRIRPGLKG